VSSAELLAQLAALGARVWLEEDAVRVNAPRGSVSDELWAELRESKNEIRQHLKHTGGALLMAKPRPARLPLSFAQQRLWFVDRMEGGSPQYNVPETFRLRGELDVAALDRALQTVVARHESLRTHFAEVDGEAEQIIAPYVLVSLPLDDLTALDDDARDAAVAAAIGREWEEPFDLLHGPVLRVRLLKLGEREHIFLRTLHHIVTDGWSSGVLNREISALYRGETLPPLPLQYADVALWQRSSMSGRALERGLAYWRDQLAGIPERLELPADRPRPVVQTYAAGMHRSHVPAGVTGALNELGKTEQATLYMTMLTAFASLLQRYSGQRDIVVGSPIANRQDAQMEGLIGFFVNSLVLRTRVPAGASFRELLRDVARVTLDAYQHQDIPFEKLVEDLAPQRGFGHAPIFQVLFALQNAPEAPQSLAGVEVEQFLEGEVRVRFDLELHAVASGGGIDLVWIYNEDLFERWRIEQMARHYEALLRTAASAPDRPLRTVSLLDAGERREVLETFNDTARPVPDAALPSLFEEQVDRTPHAAALLDGGRSLSYRDLDAEANRLAHELIGRGVGPETIAGICLERSFDLVVTVLAVLKAGGAYLPLDPHYPEARLRYMMDDAAASVIVTGSEWQELFPAGAPLLFLDAPESAAAIADASAERPTDRERRAPLHAATPVYVTYTSGSTGTPKGVVGTAYGVVNRLQWAWTEMPFEPGEVCCLKTSFSFGDFVAELLSPLLAGVPLVIFDAAAVRDVAAFVDGLIRSRVTRIVLVPSLLREILLQDPELLRQLDGLKFWSCSGEALPSGVAHDFRRQFPNARLYNIYGSTEVAADASAHVVDEITGGAVPIGRPLANFQLRVLDEDLEPVPAGVAGELYVSSGAIARGYLGRRAMTAERFVADPYARVAGARMYRTGDLARWRRDGELEFLGRADHQVKVRGFRIEPAEIEAALCTFSGIARAVVLAREDGPGDDQDLVAYLVPIAGRRIDLSELRAHLGQHLPSYMVPSAFVRLDALPLTPSGKLNRAALPAPDRKGESHRAPRTPREEILCGIFAETLALSRIGIDDNFFNLGGHSLLATRVASRICAALGVEMPIRMLFEAPTVAELAPRLDGATALRPPLLPRQRPARPPLSYAAQRLWFLYQMDGAVARYNIPVAVRLEGALDADALERALFDVLERHETLRTIFCDDDGVPFQKVLPAAESGFRLHREPAGTGDLAQTLTNAATVAIELRDEIPFRASLFMLEPAKHVLLLVFHHIAADGWSMGPFGRDLARAYAARMSGKAPAFAPLPVQYADYSVWQRDWLGTTADAESVMSQQVAYWRTALAGAPQELILPADHARPAVTTGRGGIVRVLLSAALHQQVVDLARSSGASAFMIFYAALAALLSRLGAGSDVPIGTVTAGRNERALEDLIGFFVNTLVLRADLSDAPTFRMMVARSRAQALEAYAHQDLPFEQLVEALEPERSLGRHPLFQVLLVLQNAAAADLSLPGLAAQWQPIDTGVAKFDLTLALRERFGSEGRPLGVDAELEFSWDLFEPATAAMIASRFERLLSAALAHPDIPLNQLDILDPEERQALLDESNATAHYIPQTTVNALFEAQVSQSPQATAVIACGTALSYRELNARANRVAHTLIAHGAGPESIVGIKLHRSLEMVVTILGIVKAGAAYLPLDPDLPPERIERMLLDANPVAVVDPSFESLADAPAHDPRDADRIAPLLPQHPAYVIYTSGSTGMPKGAANVHLALVNRLLWMQHAYGLDASDRVLQKTPFSFDVSVWEFFWPLIAGAAIVVAEPQKHKDPEYLHAIIAAEHVTTVHFVPSMLGPFLEAAGDGGSSLRRVICSGEALPGNLQARFFERLPGVALHNLYGPTEAAIDVTAWSCRASDGERTPPIGAPIWNTRTYVLDAMLEPVPAGVAGEIYLAGVGLARAYVNRRALTAERFVADPHALTPGARMYRTGDLARWRPDGALEYLGRADDQVKIRGFRIEPGEIEIALASLPDVARAAVVARDDGPGGRQLVAYVVPDAGAALDIAVLRVELGKRLPEFMVPAAFVILAELPLSPNGKLDRRALPAPERRVENDREPRTAQERILSAIVAEVLQLPRVGIDANFFALGGDSILSIQLVSRARRAGFEISPRDIFQQQTVAGLAAVARPVRAPAVRIDPQAAVGDLTPTPIMKWFAARGALSKQLSQSMLLRAPRFDEHRLSSALQALLDMHDVLRLRAGAGGTLRIEPRGSVQASDCWTRAALGDLAAAARAAEERLDPEAGRVLQAVWLDGGDAGDRLLLVAHHLAVDGVSWRILLTDIAQAWSGAPLDPVPTPFRVWSEHLEAQATSPAVLAELPAWQAIIDVGGALVPGAAAGPSRHMQTMTVGVSSDLTAAILTSIPAAFHARPQDAMIAALALAAAQWRRTSGHDTGDPLLIHIEGHGREATEAALDLSRTVGWFTTLFPVSVHTNSLDAARAMKTVKEQLRAAPGAGLGYGLLQSHLARRADPQIIFNYLGRFAVDADGGDWSFAPEGAPLPRIPALHLLGLDAVTLDGRDGAHLRVTFSWSGPFTESDVRTLAGNWTAAAAALAASAEQGVGGHTPSDFPLAALTQDAVERIETAYANVDDVLPLSPLQEGLVFHALYDHDALDVYTVQLALELEGSLDVARMRAAAHTLLRRYPNLAVSIFHEGLARPVQVLPRDFDVPWREEDVAARSIDEILAADRAERFDLSRGPLLRFLLLRLEAGRHLLVLTSHHVLMDGWSTPLFFGELFALYRGEALPPARPYASYLAWIETQDAEAALGVWRDVLSGVDGPTLLAGPAGRSPLRAEPQRCERDLSATISSRLRHMARQRGVTLNTVVQAAWALLLGRLTGRDDVIFGIAVSGRPAELAGVERMIGLFINTQPLRVRIDPGQSFASLLARIQETQSQMLAVQHVGLADIQRAAGQAELFDNILVFDNYPLDVEAFSMIDAGLRLAGAASHDATHYPLSLVAVPGERMHLQFDYDPTRFGRAAVERLMQRLETLLSAAAADPDLALHRLELFDGGEREALLQLGAREAATFESDASLTRLFESQVARTPDAIAVDSLTYAELNARANQLAHHLIALGVGPESLVGISLERSTDMVVAILGILKAGAAYLPLDPEYPEARIKGMLDDARPAVLLDALPELDHYSTTNPGVQVLPDNPAYIIYTSGSTGTPKGVVVTHGNVVRLFDATRQWYCFGPTDVWTLFHSYAFDFSVWEIWGALLYGGRLVVVPRMIARSPVEFLALLAAERVTVLNQTPSAFYQLMQADAETPADLHLRCIVFGGEALDPARLEPWYRRHPDVPLLINMYGITETTVHVSYLPLDRESARTAGGSVVGTNIPDLRIYVLDHALEPAPAGVTGELYVAGAGLARGYLNRPGLTSQRFVADPHNPRPGVRMYRTGDLGKWRADGVLEFLGRADQQVKIRGFRIELGEIEAALLAQPDVTHAAVIARDQQLIAYVVPRAHPLRELARTPAERYELPNGMLVSQQNRSESDFLYREIFEDESYLKHGIVLEDDACVFDVGANIGLFTLFVRDRAPRAAVYAFEPIPAVFESLRLNAQMAGGVTLFDCALSNAAGDATFTWYRYNSVISGRYANRDDEETVKVFLHNRGADEAAAAVEEWLDSETVVCKLRTLSDVIAEEGIQRIDLLKIDVEKSELEVLEGLAPHDWPKIQQLVIEVHDLHGRLATVTRLLETEGFELVVEQDALLLETNLYSIYARRPGPRRSAGTPPRQCWNPSQYTAALREQLIERLPDYMVPAAIVLLDALPLTSNGKLDRRALPAPERQAETSRPARTEAEATLSRVFAEVLKLDRVGVTGNFFSLGGDSIMSIQLVGRARAAGLDFTPREVFQHPTVEALAAIARRPEMTTWTPADAAGELTATPVMRWFLDRGPARTFHQSMAMPLPPGVTRAQALDALQTLIDHHDILRLRIDGDVLWIAPHGSISAEDCFTCELDPAAGRMVQAEWSPDELLLRIHHLAVDGVSWRILLSDWTPALAGEPLAATTPFRVWAGHLAEQARSAQRVAELPEWERILDGGTPLLPGHALDPTTDTAVTAGTLRVELPPAVTSLLLTALPAAFDVRINDILLVALAEAVTGWRGGDSIIIELEGHGREGNLDLSRTVGWFTTIFPISLRAGSLEEIKAQLRDVPGDTLGYGLLRHLNEDTAPRLAERAQPQIGFNYLGRFDAGAELDGGGADAAMPLFHLLDVNAMTIDDAAGPSLAATWTWAGAHLREDDVRGMATRWQRALETLAQLARVELPLSPLQEGLVFHALSEESAPDVYTVQVAVNLEGPLDAPRLHRAATTLVQRHANLRVSIRHEGVARPVQVLEREVDVPWREEDFREELIETERARFDLTRAPLLRFLLLRIDGEHHRLVFTCHHVLVDGWSMPLLFAELLSLYRGDVLPPARPYADYVAWLARQDRAAALAAWDENLRGAEGTLIGSGAPAGTPRRIEHEIASGLTSRLQRLARERGLTFNTVLQGAWALLLARITGRDDVVFGVTVSDRPAELPGVEQMIGLFINTLPLRIHVRWGATTSEFLSGIQDAQSLMLPHQHIGLRDLPRDLFDTLVIFENYPAQRAALEARFDGVRVTGSTAFDVTHYPLTLVAIPGECLHLHLDYDPARVDTATAELLAARLLRLLDAMAADPDAPVYRLDREELVLEGGPLPHALPSLPDAFEAQAACTPEAISVIAGDEQVTFAELNARANRVAHDLIARGAGPEVLVAVLLPRSIDLIAALLGVLKAGAAYVPLDPGHPRVSIEGMLAIRTLPDDGPSHNPARRIDPRQSAYVLYTSGSTGKPKGVVIEHGALSSYLAWAGERYEAGTGEGAPLNTAIGFDATITSLYLPLISGRPVILLTEEMQIEQLAELLGSGKELTLVKLTPAHLKVLRGLVDVTRMRARRFVVGGEALPAELASFWRAHAPLVNEYGPTETVVGCCIHELDTDEAPIGLPTPGTRLYVLDSSLEPVPRGVTGELYIAGAQLGRGYLDMPALTAERFLADPHASEAGARMYRTGDLVRLGGGGALEFLGRADEQVKIRGFRIEPAEIESALTSLAGVEQAAVIAREEQLIAYIVGEATEDELRRELAERLPEYMVPAAFVRLDALPLTTNGKLDRRALPAPDRRAGSDLAPRSEREEILCRVIAELLKLERVGIDDNFFRLGGDSIVSIQLVSRARREGLELTARDVFQRPAVRALAAAARRSKRAPEWDTGEAIGALATTPTVRWFISGGGELRTFTQSMAVPLPNDASETQVEAALQMLLDHHDALRMRLENSVAVIAPRGAVPARDCLTRALDIEAGRAVQARWSPGRLDLTIHHLAVDGVSWRILTGDLAAALHGDTLDPVPTPFRVWTRKLAERENAVLAQLPQWQAILAGGGALFPKSRGPYTTLSRTIELEAGDAASRAGIEAVLLAALAEAAGKPLLVDVEGHGRDGDLDLSRTAGWFTSIFPVRLDSGDVRHVKEQLRAVPDRGHGYGLLRERLAAHDAPQVAFNYLGRFDETGSDSGGGDPTRLHPLTLTAAIAGDRLIARWDYAPEHLSEDDALALIAAWQAAVPRLAAGPSLTPSDFPLVALTQEQVDELETVVLALEDILPLSPLQEGLLFHSMLDESAPDVYTVQIVADIEGALNPARMHDAARAMLRRHRNLGVVIRQFDRPVQILTRDVDVPWRDVDLSTSIERREALLAEDRAAHFDFARGPLLRFLCMRTAPERYTLVFTSHHALLDGWSMPLFFSELFALYHGAPALPDAAPFADYLAWLARQDRDAARAAWRDALADVDGATRLAASSLNAPIPQRCVADVSGPATAALQRFARDQDVTLNTVLQALWAVLLGHVTGRDDVVFGVTVAGRPPELPGVERMIGQFINTLPLRVRLRAGERLSQLTARIHAEQAQLLPHQQLGLAEIQSAAGTGELFDTVVVFENYPALADAAQPESLRIVAAEGHDATHYAMSLIVVPGDRMHIRLDYDAARIDRPVAQSILDRLMRMLDAAAGDRLAVLDEGERDALLQLGAREAATFERDASLTQLFESQVARTPDAIAVASLTYSDLNARANQLAHHLIALGVGPESLVGISLERSADMVVAILGILKAGAAYLPLDPEYPEARIKGMLEDAKPAVVLDALPQLDHYSAANPHVHVLPDNPAYIIYTSGSTGTPKGVVVTHRNVVRLFDATRQWYSFGPSDVWTLFHSYAFDFSVWEIWGALLYGGRLVVVPRMIARSPAEFLALLAAERVTVLNQTPSAFYQLMQADAEAPADLHLRCIVFGGEALEPARLEPWYRRHPNVPVLINMYGITETTVHVSYLPLDRESARTAGGSVVGTNIPDLRIYVLDHALEPAPVGVTGELYVAGAGLARGYLNRPGLTSQRFVADPHNPQAGARMYRTGDLGKWRADGVLEFLGRADQQVKIRGFRIEPGEIEAALIAEPNVTHAAVIARDDHGLVAYVVSDNFDAHALRAALGKRLPDYMVPASFVNLASLPLTPHGKLDRRALPAPERTLDRYRAPRTAAEEALCTILADVLKLDRVGVDDDFFALGGHSLLAASVAGRVRAALGVELPIRTLFETPTASGLAAILPHAPKARPALARRSQAEVPS
jgi:amino acid adenylation domain-containing protein/FkbM family methyltransferase/non-ribosomal peptide synthase protein (TIGR01720 family)